MASPPRDQVESVLAQIIKEALARRETVHVPGFGSFDVRHTNSTVERLESGEVRILPPSDEIVFTPED